MISLPRAARVSGEGLSPDASSLGSVCMFAASGPDCEGARLWCAAARGVVSEVPDPRLSVMASLVVDFASLGSLCTCTAARVGGAARAASGSPRGAGSATVGGVTAILTSVVAAS